MREIEGDDTPDVSENTQLWAHATGEKVHPPKQENIEIGAIETEKMNLQEKSNLLHSVAMSAESDLHNIVEMNKRSEDQERTDRYRTAEELDEQSMQLNRMNFSANDLNNFSALQIQKSDQTYENPVVVIKNS
jgi:hypothetical protein